MQVQVQVQANGTTKINDSGMPSDSQESGPTIPIASANANAAIANGPPPYAKASPKARAIFQYWTAKRVANAMPRHYVLDPTTGTRSLRKHSRSLVQTPVADEAWTGNDVVTYAAGRLLFTMSAVDYLCTATVINDQGTVGRSLLITAAHCAYDEENDVFASNFMFIPHQDDGGTDGSDHICSNDKFGCWVLDFAVVDSRWADQAWPSNIPYDYAVLTVPDAGAWTAGYANTNNPVLDSAVPTVEVDFTNAQGLVTGSWTQFHGYSYNQDPNFRYCRVQVTSNADRWVMPGCLLSGGASGGPCQPNLDGNGKLYTVVSYSYSSGGVQQGMGGARLNDNSFSCLFEAAKTTTANTILTYGGLPCPITTGSPTPAPATAPPTTLPPAQLPATLPPTLAPATTCSTVGSCAGLKGSRCSQVGCLWCGGSAGCFQPLGNRVCPV